MVSSLRFTAIALVAIAVAFVYVESKKCHFCNSKEDCKKNNNTGLGPADCGYECAKIDNSKGEAMNRSCITEEQCDLYRYCYLCKEENCNSSSSVSPSFIIMGIVGAILAKYYM